PIAGLVHPCEYVLEGEQEPLVQHHVLPGPGRLLAEELLEPKVRGDQDVFVLPRDLDEPGRGPVSAGPAQWLLRIAADAIAVQELALEPVVRDEDERLQGDRVAPVRGNHLDGIETRRGG